MKGENFMTGRDLILYILNNGLENEPVFKNGNFIGFLSIEEVAAKMSVGTATVRTLIGLNRLEGVKVNHGVYVPANFKVENL